MLQPRLFIPITVVEFLDLNLCDTIEGRLILTTGGLPTICAYIYKTHERSWI